MSIKGKAYVVGVFEHPTREATGPLDRRSCTPSAPRARWPTPA